LPGLAMPGLAMLGFSMANNEKFITASDGEVMGR